MKKTSFLKRLLIMMEVSSLQTKSLRGVGLVEAFVKDGSKALVLLQDTINNNTSIQTSHQASTHAPLMVAIVRVEFFAAVLVVVSAQT